MKEIYESIISDVSMEISIASEWRRKIFSLREDENLEISFRTAAKLPSYIREDIVTNKLTLNERNTMFIKFKEKVEVLENNLSNEIRKKYIDNFVNSSSESYQMQIQSRQKFVDGYCYLGYSFMRENTNTELLEV